jgi:hypothetical protein
MTNIVVGAILCLMIIFIVFGVIRLDEAKTKLKFQFLTECTKNHTIEECTNAVN